MAVNENTRIRGLPEDPAVGPGVIITGSAQSFDPCARYIMVTTAGTLTGQMVGDTVDVAYVLPVGFHRMAFKSITSVTGLVGFIAR